MSDGEDLNLDQSNMDLSFDQNDIILLDEIPCHANSFNFASSPVSSIGSDESEDETSLTEDISMCLPSSNNNSSSNLLPNNSNVGSDHEEYISIDELRAQIKKSGQKKNSLETIFEGVFLETPPKTASKRSYPNATKTKLNLENDHDDEDIKENVQNN